jgi:DNA replication protein DnaC
MGTKRGTPPRERLSKENLSLRGVPADYIEGTLKDYKQDKDVKLTFERYLENLHDMYEDRVNMCLYGANGAGKSFLSSLIVKEAYRLRYSSYMTTLASMIDLNFKGNKSQDDYERIKFIKTADFLVIDEIGKETFTKTSSNIALLEETLRNAVKTGQVVILCTNLPLEEEGGLYEQYGASIQSLIEGSYVKIEFDGKDYRPTVFKKKKALAILQGEE